MNVRTSICVAGIGLAATIAVTPAWAENPPEKPKRGGTLTYLIPADAPPSFDAHRETTYATIHSAAPYYSVLIRVPPDNPASTTEFVCDLCVEMPKPTDNGKTYTFKIRQDVKFHDGSKLTAQDVAESWKYIVHPPKGVTSARQTYYEMVDSVEARREFRPAKGEIPSPINPPSGCVFHPRCPVAVEGCKKTRPTLRELRPRHWVACSEAK